MSAETGAGNGGDAGRLEQSILDRAGGQAGAGDVGEGVEGALGADAADPGDLVQPGDAEIAAAAEGLAHGLDGILRASQRGDAGELGGGIDAGMGVDGEPRGDFGQLLRPESPAEPPDRKSTRLKSSH